jgi:hypothetical protein
VEVAEAEAVLPHLVEEEDMVQAEGVLLVQEPAEVVDLLYCV